MRVVQLLPELNEGGVERGVVELSRELVNRGVESWTISAGGRLVKQLEADGGHHVLLDLASKNPLTAFSRIRALRRILQEIKPDILHARSRVPAWLAVLANRKLKLPFVTTVHGFNSVNRYSQVMTAGNCVICVSGAIRDYVVNHYAVAEDKLVVIPRGVDLVQFDPACLDQDYTLSFRAKFKLDERFVVSSVGRVTQLKDYETFLRAIGLIRQHEPTVLGLIVGGVHPDKRDYFTELQKLVSKLGLENHICFTGSQREVAEIYSLSRVVVSSSKKPESFGRSAAEALAMGVPVVASGHGGMLDIVIDGQTGHLFEPGNAVELAEKVLMALEHPWSNLREFVSHNFTLEQMDEKTVAVYLGLVSEGIRLAKQVERTD